MERNNRSADFTILPTDRFGHSAPLTLRVPAEQRDLIKALVRAKRFPYCSDGHLVRHGIVRHLEWLRTLDELYFDLGEYRATLDIPAINGWDDLLQSIAEDRLLRQLEHG